MNEHAAPNQPGGYLFEFNTRRFHRRDALRVSGIGAVMAAAIMAVLGSIGPGNPAFVQTNMSIPLAITFISAGAVLLMVDIAGRRSRPKPPKAARPAGKQHSKGTIRDNPQGFIAAELALLADLYAKGALTPEEFAAAKRRVIGE